ncbi:MAG: VOC family protein [Micromonosporaceae bacterium]
MSEQIADAERMTSHLYELVDDPHDGIALLPSDDTGFRIRLLPTQAQKTGQNQMHFDLTSTSLEDQQRTVARALGLGAQHIDVGQRPEAGHVVLTDPEGNESCGGGPPVAPKPRQPLVVLRDQDSTIEPLSRPGGSVAERVDPWVRSRGPAGQGPASPGVGQLSGLSPHRCYTVSTIVIARTAASGQPPHESYSYPTLDHLLSRVRPSYPAGHRNRNGIRPALDRGLLAGTVMSPAGFRPRDHFRFDPP